MIENTIYRDILDTVVDNNRLELWTPIEVELEIEFEARARGLSKEEIKDAVNYAFEYLCL